MHTFPRPQAERLYVEREPVEGSCPECASTDIRSYRVLSEGGWWNVQKCQGCLASLRREPADALGSFVPLGTTVSTELAASQASVDPSSASVGAQR